MKKETGYWLFNCNPAIWDIKAKLLSGVKEEDWRIPQNRFDQFKKGQLGIIRVAIDKRPKKQGFEKLESGVYAIVEIEDKPFYGVTRFPELFLDKKRVVKKFHNRVPILITEDLLNNPILISDLKESEFKYDEKLFNPGQGIDVTPISNKSFFELLKHIGRKERTWLQDIILALENLNGEAHFKDIKSEVRKIRKKFNPSWDRTIQKELERHSSDSEVWRSKWKGKEDLFYNKSKGKGVWGLRNYINTVENIENYNKKLEREVKKNQKLSLAELKAKSGKNKKPKKKSVNTPNYERDAYVVAYVLKAAEGKCDLCTKNAPFKKKKTNEPYLECHHVKWLSKEGEDTIENAVALCPNCHRKMHSLGLSKDIKKLFDRIDFRKNNQ